MKLLHNIDQVMSRPKLKKYANGDIVVKPRQSRNGRWQYGLFARAPGLKDYWLFWCDSQALKELDELGVEFDG